MRSNLKSLVVAAVAAALWLAPAATMADEVNEQLKQMQDRMTQLEDRLAAAADSLEAANQRADQQAQLIERAGLNGAPTASSGLASFLESIEIGGWIAGSYFYNFDKPDGRDQGGFNGGPASNAASAFYPFHPDSNTFQLDQLWLEVERSVNEENRAGFRADFVYGKLGDILNNGVSDGISGSDEDFHLYQGYVQYLAPVGNGIHFKFGKFATLIGAEVAQTTHNFNITRGNVYNLFQPITHTGILASTDFGEGLSATVGFVNETRSATDVDTNKNKALLWSLGWSGETVGLSFNGTYGDADSGQALVTGSAATGDTRAKDKETIYDVILSWNPNEMFSGYINADYIESENSNPVAGLGTLTGEYDGYGIAVAGRYALTERLGAALRGEWVDLNLDRAAVADADVRIWGVTGTLDYALTNALKLRTELRWDVANQSDSSFRKVFLDSPNPATSRGTFGGGIPVEEDQLTAGVEVVYSF